jgi:CRISPR/Cas system-associated exonuclease Cas4 (RecB family)
MTIKPSSYFRCMRKTWYDLLQYPAKNKISPKGTRVFAVGTATHEYIQDGILKLMAEDENFPQFSLVPAEELPCYGKDTVEVVADHPGSDIEIKIRDTGLTEKYPVSYMVDGAFEFRGTRYIFEFKTMNSKEFEYLIEPKRDHIAQGAVYALCTGIRKVMFLYMNKDTQELKAYVNNYTDEQLEWAKNRIVTIDNKLVNLELPEQEASSDECRWCPYRTMCESNYTATEYTTNEDGFKIFKQ